MGPWKYPGKIGSLEVREARNLSTHTLAEFPCLVYTIEPRNPEDVPRYWKPRDCIGSVWDVSCYWDRKQKWERPGLIELGKPDV